MSFHQHRNGRHLITARGGGQRWFELLKTPITLSIISGILLALSYPKFNIWIFAWAALVPLLFAIEGKNYFQSFGLGWLTGFTMFIGQIFWLKIFHVSIPFLLSAYFGLCFGLFCLLCRFIKDRLPITDLIIIPVIWTLIEFVRSIGSWGFPAGLLGYSQHQNLPLIQIADIIGVYGVSFLLALINASLFSIIRKYSFPRAINVLSVLIIILTIVFAYSGVKISRGDNIDKNIKLALIQPNINYADQQNSLADQVLTALDKLTSQAVKERPDLIIWPETVIKESVRLDPAVSKKLNKLVNKYKTYLLFGNPDVKMVNGSAKHFNSAFLVAPAGEVLTQYNKIHPVPFWEVMPIRNYLPFLKNTESKGTCARGGEFTVFDFPKGKFSVLICFEGIYPGISRSFVNSGAQFLVNISNDSWSASAAEHYQHAAMDIFRAIENGIYYVRVGNSGVTEVIDPFGKIVEALPIYQRGYLIAEVGLKNTKTLYSRFGDIFVYLSLFFTIGMLGLALLAKGRGENEK